MKYISNMKSSLGIKGLLLLCLSLVLAACGGDNNTSSSTDSAVNAAPTRAADLSLSVVAPRTTSMVQTIASLQITVVSQDTQEVQEATLTAADPTVVLRLIPGSYDITVVAFDASGQALSQGAVTLTDVVAGERYTVALTLEDILPALIPVITADAGNLGVDELSGQYLLDLTGLNLESSLILPLSATSSSGAVSTYSWSIVSGPVLAGATAELFDEVGQQTAQTASGDITTLNYFRATDPSIIDGTEDSLVLRLTLTDEGGNTESTDLTIDLLYTDIPNVAPIAAAGNDFSIENLAVDPQQSPMPLILNLDGAASYDEDGTINSYQWTLLSGNTQELLFFSEGQTPGSYVIEVGPGYSGPIEFELTVTDNEGGVGTDTIVITVTPPPNQAPAAIIYTEGPTTLGSFDGFTYLDAFDSFDIDGNIVDYSWTIVNSAALGTDVSFIELEGPLYIEVDWIEGFVGDIEMQLQVTDDQGAIDTDTIIISIVAEPTAMFTPASGILNTFDGGFVIDGTGSVDAQGGSLSYSWEVSDPNNFFLTDNGDGTATIEWSPGIVAVLDVYLTVTNGSGLSGFASESFSVEIPVQGP
tara:strand:- start:16558 stop:18318 length:1761 start_codon:yes stop_codon:yes gene_type:complete